MVKTIKIKDDDIPSRLAKLGSVSETYEDVIRKLLDFYEKNNNNYKNKK